MERNYVIVTLCIADFCNAPMIYVHLAIGALQITDMI